MKKRNMDMELYLKPHDDLRPYPAGLGEEITCQLMEQGVCPIAFNPRYGTLYVEHRGVVWRIHDNGGELTVLRVNTDEMVSIALTDQVCDMPRHVEDYALVMVVRILAVLRGNPVDYTWRLPDGNGRSELASAYDKAFILADALRATGVAVQIYEYPDPDGDTPGALCWVVESPVLNDGESEVYGDGADLLRAIEDVAKRASLFHSQ